MNTIARIVTKLWPPVGETSQATGMSAPLPELDGVRSLAIMACFLSFLPASGALAADAVLSRFAFGYELLLTVFAYSLVRLLVFERRRTGQLALRNYLMRRLLALVPVGFVLITILLIWGIWSQGVTIIPDAIGLFTFTQNLHVAMTGRPEFEPLRYLGILSALFQYALALPVLAAIAVGSGRIFAFVALAWILLSMAFSAILILEGWPGVQILALTPFRPEAILTGAAIAVFEGQLWKFRRKRIAAVLVFAASAIGLIVFETGGASGWQDIARTCSNALLAGLCLAGALMWRPVTRLLSLTPIVWIGRMWLPLYLLIWPSILFTRELLPPHLLTGWPGWLLLAGVAALAAVSLAALAWYAFERRILKLRRHYEFIEGRPLRL